MGQAAALEIQGRLAGLGLFKAAASFRVYLLVNHYKTNMVHEMLKATFYGHLVRRKAHAYILQHAPWLCNT